MSLLVAVFVRRLRLCAVVSPTSKCHEAGCQCAQWFVCLHVINFNMLVAVLLLS